MTTIQVLIGLMFCMVVIASGLLFVVAIDCLAALKEKRIRDLCDRLK